MTKTLDDYLNDPDLADEPAALREVHAIRLMIRDKTKGMTVSERTAFYNGSADPPGTWFPGLAPEFGTK